MELKVPDTHIQCADNISALIVTNLFISWSQAALNVTDSVDDGVIFHRSGLFSYSGIFFFIERTYKPSHITQV